MKLLAVAKELDTVDPRFIQDCPYCGRSNRIVMNGLFVCGNKIEKHPDMGYSFCNCRAIFYTRKENVTDPVDPLPNEEGVIIYPDPFFAWPNPYDFLFWDVRKYRVIWDLYSFCERLESFGYVIESVKRDFDVHSKTPQHFHIKVKQCQE